MDEKYPHVVYEERCKGYNEQSEATSVEDKIEGCINFLYFLFPDDHLSLSLFLPPSLSFFKKFFMEQCMLGLVILLTLRSQVSSFSCSFFFPGMRFTDLISLLAFFINIMFVNHLVSVYVFENLLSDIHFSV